jgi:hypothetical protein
MKNQHQRTCIYCSAEFETHLSMKRYCTPDCQNAALGDRRRKIQPTRPFQRDPEYAAAELALNELQALMDAERAAATPRYHTLAGTPEVFAPTIRDDQLTGRAGAFSYGAGQALVHNKCFTLNSNRATIPVCQ